MLREQPLEQGPGQQRHRERREEIQEPVQQVRGETVRVVAGVELGDDLATEPRCRRLSHDLHGEVRLLAQVPHADEPTRQRGHHECIEQTLGADAVPNVGRRERRRVAPVQESVEQVDQRAADRLLAVGGGPRSEPGQGCAHLTFPLDLFEVGVEHGSVVVLAGTDEGAEGEVLRVQLQAAERLRLIRVFDEQRAEQRDGGNVHRHHLLERLDRNHGRRAAVARGRQVLEATLLTLREHPGERERRAAQRQPADQPPPSSCRHGADLEVVPAQGGLHPSRRGGR